MSANRHQKTAYPNRHAPGGTIGKGLVKQRESFEDIAAAKAEALVGHEMAALDRYLANPSRAALDKVLAIRAKGRAA